MLVALLALALPISPIHCPVTGEPIAPESKMIDRNGIRYRFCCPDCFGKFKNDPEPLLKVAGEKRWLFGVGVFDPVSGRKLTPETATGGTSDFKGVRFAFVNAANKTAFDADPKRFGTVPERASTICPVMRTELFNTYGAPGYVDVNGVRYFACCEQCWPRLQADPAKFVGNASESIGKPKSYVVPAVWAKLSGPGF